MFLKKTIKLSVVSFISMVALVACGNETGVGPEEDGSIDTTVDEGKMETSESKTDDTTVDESTSDSLDKSQASMGLETMDFDFSLTDAINHFNENFSDPMIESIQFDEEDGEYVYDIEGFDSANDYEMRLTAESGEILFEETEEENNDDTDDSLDVTSILNPKEAMNRVLDYVGSGYVEKWELDVENDLTVYEIDLEDTEDISDDDDVKVNAQTGEIVE
ncbi:PepSY domain-containing protein [Lacticigenium naphthae]|uniref:PepSY domain-containing protein n=1 Tax=Lacticigenium naphthae TaxID=515351 RepID=UPI000403E807|nr:PepSY domain-containing protein [Lacticigenium naphthae]